MRYRIKITTFKTGRKNFRPQKKVFFGWSDLDHDGATTHLCESYVYNRKDALNRIDLNYSGNIKKQTIEFEYINKP